MNQWYAKEEIARALAEIFISSFAISAIQEDRGMAILKTSAINYEVLQGQARELQASEPNLNGGKVTGWDSEGQDLTALGKARTGRKSSTLLFA